MISHNKSELGVIAIENDAYFPFGKQVFFFEDMMAAYPESPFDVFFFSPLHWKLEDDLVTGYKFVDNEWIIVKELIPDLIYDRAFSGNEEQRTIIQDFREFALASGKRIYNPIPLMLLLNNKVAFHDFLVKKNIPTLTHYPLTALASESFLTEINCSKVYIKPTFGSQGRGIFVLEKESDRYVLYDNLGNKEIYPDHTQVYQKILSLIIEPSRYFVQEAAQLVNYNDAPFDVRVLVQNYGDEYKVTGHAVRIGEKRSMTSNLNSGGSALPLAFLNDFFEAQYHQTAAEVEKQIEDLCMECADVLSETHGDFVEIGFDVLYTLDKGPILIEANSKPSRWVFNVIADHLIAQNESATYYQGLRTETVKVPLLYANYILQQT